MTKEEKIAKIYEKIADKTLSFGCKIKYQFRDIIHYEQLIKDIDDKLFIVTNNYLKGNENSYGKYAAQITGCDPNQFNRHYKKDYKTIGHPVMIGDVLDYIENFEDGMENKIADEKGLYFGSSEYNHITYLWHNKRLPIEEQSSDCIDFVFNLLPKE